MIYRCKPSKVSIYVNKNRKTTAQIKAETGCTALINGGLFNMTTFEPVCHLKVDGKVLAKDKWGYWGFGWNNEDTTIQMVSDYSKLDNYICCVAMVRDGKAEPMIFPDDMGGYRPRTALGVFEDGSLWLYATVSPGIAPLQLQKIALNAGVKHAIMLDGGGSTQGAVPGDEVNASRIVHNYICVWETEKEVTQAMTEREKVVDTAVSFLGCKESDGSHRKIIDKYNSYTPLPQGYKVTYTDPWCATFVSAVFMTVGLTDIAPVECSCSRMIKLYKAIGRWEENDAYIPKPGDILMYDWEDNGRGDNTGDPDHVGIVVSVSGNSVKIIEGNINNAVGYRTLPINGKTIRGYCLPDYPQEAINRPVTGGETTVSVYLPQIKKGATGEPVRSLQYLLTAKGFNTKGADGIFGANTDSALRKYQKAKGLTVDGICGKDTWTTLLTK